MGPRAWSWRAMSCPIGPCCNCAMRLLLIEDDATQCEVIQQRVLSRTPDAQIVVRKPDLQGPLAPEFLAQGFDVVLLGHGRGLGDLRELTGRSGFAPVIFIAL